MMEIPQPCPFEPEGSKSTHDFLSLYNLSTSSQDPTPSSQGAHLKTHDFLQPLERIGKTCAKEETAAELVSSTSTAPEKSFPVVPAVPATVGHLLPGGIGTYSISHISYFNQRLPIKPEGSIFPVAQSSSSTERNDENSNCSSFPGTSTGFNSWEETGVKKGKTGKENAPAERPVLRESPAKIGKWTTTSERLSQSSSNNNQNSFSPRASSQGAMGKKNQTFMEMITSVKCSSQDEELDDDDEFVIKKENLIVNKGEFRTKFDGKISDQKPNTPRSKHSATEQRRRSKINDRFQMLREVIPHSDQKRDKASFLLEVIEYIQFLQEKVHKYENSYQGRSNEPAKLLPWKNNLRTAESSVDQSRDINSGSGPSLFFPAKYDEENIPPSAKKVPGISLNQVDYDISTATTFKPEDNHPRTANKAVPFHMSLQPNVFNPVRNGVLVSQRPPQLVCESDTTALQTETSLRQTRSCADGSTSVSEKVKEQDGLSIDGGTISVSSVYSQGLVNTLTQALKSSGVDLSQASISVQIELRKQAPNKMLSPISVAKDVDMKPSNLATTRSRNSSAEDSEQRMKKLKTGKI